MDYSVSKGIIFLIRQKFTQYHQLQTLWKTEVMIGNWFEKRKNREKIILASKVAGPGCDWIRGGGNSFDEKKIGEAIDGSLKD
jgi:aryl-alcohol dehydrogenase-like predicted oxidoreductase